MKWTMNRIALIGIVLLAVVLSCSVSFAQKMDSIDLVLPSYDVVYLTDFVDIRAQELNPNISGIYLNLYPQVLQEASFWVCVFVELRVQLRGEQDQWLMRAYTNNFDAKQYPMLAANNFAKSGGAIHLRDGSGNYEENSTLGSDHKTLRTRLEDKVAQNPMAPPGKYTIIMKVLPATSKNPDDRKVPTGNAMAQDSKTIIVQFSTADEVFVEINDPKTGSFSTNLAPTFSWSSSAPVKVSVYEALANQRSPQDALTGGNPSLVRQNYDEVGHPADFSGTSLTYPGNAERQLQQDKAYVLRVEARVATNRGDVMRQSLPVVFRITDDRVGQMLDNFLNTFSGSASATYATLRADPNNWIAWSPYGNITLDGSILTETDLQSLINDLASRSNLKIQLGVENQ